MAEGSGYPLKKLGSVILSCSLIVLCAGFLYWADTAARERRSYPHKSAGLFYHARTQADVYPLYSAQDIRGSHVVHLNRYFNFVEYAPQTHATVMFPIRAYDIRPLYEKRIDSHNWLFIAARTGRIRSITSVLPSSLLKSKIDDFMESPAYTFRDGRIRGYSYDLPREVVSLDALSCGQEPVILNVDAGFFTEESDPKEAATILKRKCSDIRMVVFIDSFDEPEITASSREKLRLFAYEWDMGKNE